MEVRSHGPQFINHNLGNITLKFRVVPIPNLNFFTGGITRRLKSKEWGSHTGSYWKGLPCRYAGPMIGMVLKVIISTIHWTKKQTIIDNFHYIHQQCKFLGSEILDISLPRNCNRWAGSFSPYLLELVWLLNSEKQALYTPLKLLLSHDPGLQVDGVIQPFLRLSLV